MTGMQRKRRWQLVELEVRTTPAIASFSTGTLTIDFTAMGSTAESVTLSNNGSTFTLTGNVSGTTSLPTSDVTKLVAFDSGAGGSQSLTFAGTTALALSQGLTITGIDVVTVNNAIKVAESSELFISVSRTLFVNAGLATVDGALTLKANSAATSSGPSPGVIVDAATVQSITGAITVEGRGGDASGVGVQIRGGAAVGAATTGPVTVTGWGGLGTSHKNYGVVVTGTNSKITSGGGNVVVTGTGGGSGTSIENHGIHVAFAGEISAGGNGSVSLTGIGGKTAATNIAQSGIWIKDTGTRVTTNDGPIKLTGTGGASVGGSNFGVYVSSAAEVSAGGSGSIMIEGAGGQSDQINHGVYVYSLVRIKTAAGHIHLQGAGGVGHNSRGVVVGAGSEITISGAGHITIEGKGGDGGQSNYGVEISDPSVSKVTTANGNISITGYGGTGNPENGLHYGVLIARSLVIAGGVGTVTILGIGGPGAAGGNIGVWVNGSGAKVSSQNGSVSITGHSGTLTGGTGGNLGVLVATAAEVSAGGAGQVQVFGYGGPSSGSGGDGSGVVVKDSGSRITSSGGDVMVVGKAAEGASYGLRVDNAGEITAGGSGVVTVTGTGNPAGTGTGNFGVQVRGTNSRITSSGGLVTIIASGNANSEAVRLETGGTIASGGMADLVIVADSINVVDTSSSFKAGSASDRTMTIRPNTAGTKIGLGAADVLSGSPLTLGLTATEFGRISAGTIQLGDGIAGAINVSAAITRSAATNLTLTTADSIGFAAGLNSAGGHVVLNAKGSITQTAGTILTGAGNLTINGPGQIATFASSSNKSAQLLIPTDVTVWVNGSFDTSGNVQVAGTLGGHGINSLLGVVGSTTVSAGGTIRPGTTGPGRLTTSAVTFQNGSNFHVQLNGTTAGTNYSQMIVNGPINLNGAKLQGSVGFTPPANQVFKIIDNTKSGSVTGTFAGLAEGATVALGGKFFIVSYQGGDGNDVTLKATTVPPPPIVSVLTIDNGSAQRSVVRSINVTFSAPITLEAGAFQLTHTGFGNPGTVDLDINHVGSDVTITFKSGGTVGIEPSGSLADGQYQLVIHADKVLGAGGKLDGNANGLAEGSPDDNHIVTFHRLFGDADGNGVITAADFNAFRLVYGLGEPSIFDFNGDGQVSESDFNEFRLRFGVSVVP
jgi:hypothetical protein